MPKKIPFTSIGKFDSVDEFQTWQNDHIFSWAVETTHTSRCTVCQATQHKMKTQYAVCNNVDCNKKSPCGVRYKIVTCLKRQKVEILKIGEHKGHVLSMLNED